MSIVRWILMILLIFSMRGCESNDIPYHDRGMEDGKTLTERTEITLDDAKRIALQDAGVRGEDVTFTKAKKEYERGQEVYDLEFYTTEAEYEYEIKVSDGVIVGRDVEVFAQGGQKTSGGASVGLEQAKAIALEHAKVKEDAVTLKEAKRDWEDGVEVYEIEFYYAGKEYEYKIRVSDGSILEYEIEGKDR